MRAPFLAEKEVFSIGEVSRITGVKPYILRYWESQFALLRPARRPSGQRRFSRRDVETVSKVRELLYERRFTLQGAKKFLRRQEKAGPMQQELELTESVAAVETLKDVKKELVEILKVLKEN